MVQCPQTFGHVVYIGGTDKGLCLYCTMQEQKGFTELLAEPLSGFNQQTTPIKLYPKHYDVICVSVKVSVSASTDRGYGTCEIDWAKANYSTIHKSYIITILILCFFVPVLIMLFCYVSIINTVKRGNAMSADGDLTDRQRKIERDVTVVSGI